ncbi:MAG: ASKHA domain-containing protein [Candidatus Eisenbacteria bacterium]
MVRESPSGDKDNLTIRFFPFDTSVTVAPGTTVLDAVRKAGLPLKAACGGEGTCGTCVVKIIEGTYETRPSAALPEHLIKQGYALACVTEVRDNLSVDLPHFEELYIRTVASFRLEDVRNENVSASCRFDPVMRKVELEVPLPSLEDNYSDLRRVKRELRTHGEVTEVKCEYSVLKNLARSIREKSGAISTVIFTPGREWTIIDVKPGGERKGIYGVACDIGTTTVALNLVNLENGDILETAIGLNRQIKCGEDIISRINYAGKPGRLEELHELIVATMNNLIEMATEDAGISPSDICYVSISGNTTMIHLLLGLDPRHIREEPYVPTVNRVPFVLGRDLGLKINHEARVHCAPAVGSYVGGDITAGLLATPMLRDSEKVSMFIDAGTNGELVIGNKDWQMTCACSAGPAFEGGGVRCGMPATEGAIESVKIRDDGKIEYEVIDGKMPRGICGSGLVDLLAELLRHDYIDRQGKFKRPQHGTGFLVEKGANCYWGKDLVITEKDIATLIRTKAAVFSACSLLLKNVGLTFDEIDALYIAGGFGQHLGIENAIRIGLLPDLKRSRFRYLGNSSLFGAYLILLSDENRAMVDELSEKITYVELNTDPAYMNEYTGALFLPHTDLTLFPSSEA